MRLWLSLAAAAALSAGCADPEAQEQARIQRELLADTAVPVTFAEPRVETVESYVEVSGPMETLHEVQLGAKTAGRLTMVAVKEGSRVSAGQVVARVETSELDLDVRQVEAALEAARSQRDEAALQAAMSPAQTDAAIRQAEAALASAKARLDLVRKGAREQEKRQAQERVNAAKASLDKAKADLDRMRRLYADEAVARSDVDAAQLQHDLALAEYRSALEAYDQIVEGARPEEIRQAEEAVRQAEEGLRAAKAGASMDAVRKRQLEQAEAGVRQAEARLRLARTRLADADIRSPIAGYVAGTPAQVGQVVGPGSPVARIVSLEAVYFEGQVPERELSLLRAGQRAEVRVDAFPDRDFKGVVAAVSPRADQLGRLFRARIALEGVGGELRPGMFARGRIHVGSEEGAVLVPKDALVRDGEAGHVFVAEGGVARRADVETGVEQGDWIQVKGLPKGARVVVRGKDRLTDGAEIREDREAGRGG